MTKSQGNDDATLFEEWTARYNIMKDEVKILNIDNDITNPEQLQRLLAASIAARAGRLTSLQCALLDGSDDDNQGKGSSTLASVEALLDRIKMDMDKDAASDSQLILLDRIANLSNLDIAGSATDDDNAEVDNDDVDAFFTEYPECIRRDWDEISDNSDDESDEDDCHTDLQQLRPKSKSQRLASGKNLSSKGNAVSNDRDLALETQKSSSLCSQRNEQPGQHETFLAQASNTHAQDRPIPCPKDSSQNSEEAESFSYSSSLQRASSSSSASVHPQQPRLSHHQNSSKTSEWSTVGANSRTMTSHPSYLGNAPLTANTSWEDHRNQQNPFQTAREYAQSGVADNAESQPRRSAPSQGRSSDVHNPYTQGHWNNRQGEVKRPVSGGPKIPDSLKRKFQPPKRVETKSKQGTHTHATDQATNKKGGDLTLQSKKKSGESDDEELPEELQHLDKELVKKIENEIIESGDTVTFDDIAGLEDAKQTVQEVVCWPMKRPDLFTGLRRAPNGLLLYGPPGTGKTLIGKAIAHESGATFFSISSSSLTSKWIGEGEKLVRTLFAVAAYREPAVVFIDEIDSLLTQRKASENEASRRIKTEFLVQIDGTGTSGQGRVLVIGATNRPQELDEAARRRFVKRLYIPLPNEKDRAQLLHALLRKNNHCLVDDDVQRLAKETEGFSGADLKALCNDSALWPIRQLGSKALEVDVKDVPPISFKHFKRSLKGMKPSVGPADLVAYIEWDKVYGSKRVSEEWEDDEDSD